MAAAMLVSLGPRSLSAAAAAELRRSAVGVMPAGRLRLSAQDSLLSCAVLEASHEDTGRSRRHRPAHSGQLPRGPERLGPAPAGPLPAQGHSWRRHGWDLLDPPPESPANLL